ncbi:hypothetical protein [Aureimonas sp. AU20]|uniref:hypothetical protein n=1 Tax=Aureimonas sp. AU20 TaxID=1349819 RepID=UPI0007217E5A|nr:hypothetical protein [Aureimonas sp. AU20]ALN73337.1 hypothetical protein M673_11460 [Aureimonas sp. AU20]
MTRFSRIWLASTLMTATLVPHLAFAQAATDTPSAAAPPSATETTPTTEAPPAPAASLKPQDEAGRNAKVLSAIAGLDPLIGDVQLVGPWTDGDRHGVWRTVMTQPAQENGGNRFFVQQIEQSGDVSHVSSSIEVTEIAEVKGAVVGYRADPPAEGQESNLTLFFDILPLDGEVTDTYELFIAPNTPYRFGPATN